MQCVINLTYVQLLIRGRTLLNIPDPDEIKNNIDFTGHNYYALEVILKSDDYFDFERRTQCTQGKKWQCSGSVAFIWFPTRKVLSRPELTTGFASLTTNDVNSHECFYLFLGLRADTNGWQLKIGIRDRRPSFHSRRLCSSFSLEFIKHDAALLYGPRALLR